MAIFTESVQKTEARCAGIHEELTRMALSEQYMRTKQAQLLAKKKEMAAKEAMERAEIREREAAVSDIISHSNIRPNFHLQIRLNFLDSFLTATYSVERLKILEGKP